MPRAWCIAVLVIALGACRHGFDFTALDENGLEADAGPGFDSTLGDAASAGDAPVDLGPWGTPQPIASLDLGQSYDDPTLTGDLLEIFFNANDDIWVATRLDTAADWGMPVLVDGASGPDIDTTPEVSPDGLTMFLARDVGTGSDIYVTTRTARDSPWSDATLVTELSDPVIPDTAGGVQGDLLEVVFTSGRDGYGRDIYLAGRSDPTDLWNQPQRLDAVNSALDEHNPFLDESGRTLYFDGDPDGDGDDDIYVATRSGPGAPFSTPVRIAEVSSAENDSDAWVSRDGRYMVFSRGGVLYEVSR